MTRQVTLRDVKLDQIKAAITAAAVGGFSPEARSWAVARWGEAGAPAIVDKTATSSLLSDNLDTDAVGLVDRALFGAIRERAVLYRLRGLRRTGFNVRTIVSGGAGAAWVAPGAAIPVFKPDITNSGLDPAKLCGIVIATDAALRAAPGIEQMLFDDLVRAYTDEIDAALLDPGNAGTPGLKPAAITHDAPTIAATSSIAADLAALVAAFEGDLSAAYFTMAPATAAKLAAIGDGTGDANGYYRDVGVRGGDLMGVPVLTARNAPTDSMALIDPTGIAAAYDEDVLLESGREGSVELDDAPTGNSVTPTGTTMVSLFQLDLVAFRSVGNVAWSVARPGSVAVLQGGGTDWMA